MVLQNYCFHFEKMNVKYFKSNICDSSFFTFTVVKHVLESLERLVAEKCMYVMGWVVAYVCVHVCAPTVNECLCLQGPI